MTLDAVREQVAEAGRRLAAKELVLGTAGNVSARHDDAIAITPTSPNVKTALDKAVAAGITELLVLPA